MDRILVNEGPGATLESAREIPIRALKIIFAGL